MRSRLRRHIGRYLLHPAEQKPIAPVLGLTFFAIVIAPVLADHRLGSVVAIALVGGSAYLALIRTGAHGLFRRIAEVIVVLATVVAVLTPILNNRREDDVLQVISMVLFVLLLLVTPMVVLTRMLLRPRIDVDTVAGALAAYLQIALFFAALYRLVDLVSTEPFFVQGPQPPFDFMYFSFVTITTTGYGDLTAAAPVGRTLAILEALIGQIFLVTVVALIVSNLGRDLPGDRIRQRMHPDGAGDGTEDGAEEAIEEALDQDADQDADEGGTGPDPDRA